METIAWRNFRELTLGASLGLEKITDEERGPAQPGVFCCDTQTCSGEKAAVLPLVLHLASPVSPEAATSPKTFLPCEPCEVHPFVIYHLSAKLWLLPLLPQLCVSSPEIVRGVLCMSKAGWAVELAVEQVCRIPHHPEAEHRGADRTGIQEKGLGYGPQERQDSQRL